MLPEMISGPVMETDAQIQRLLLSAETERGPHWEWRLRGRSAASQQGAALSAPSRVNGGVP